MAKPPIASAITASKSQVINQPFGPWKCPIAAAMIADTPMATPPQPGTPVNDPARSMVSRMNRRFSMACVCNEIGSFETARMGWAEAMRKGYLQMGGMASTLFYRVGLRQLAVIHNGDAQFIQHRAHGRIGQGIQFLFPAFFQPRSRGPQLVRAKARMTHELGAALRQLPEQFLQFL